MNVLNRLSKSLLLCCLLGMSHSLVAADLKLVTDDGPPHMMSSTDSGLDIDIVRAILAEAGYTVQVEYMSLARAKRAVRSGVADIVVPTSFEQDGEGYYVSLPVVDYLPTVFSLKSNGFHFSSFDDIANLRVMTFQGAVGYFGNQFEKVIQQNNYIEVDDMTALPKLLARNRADVVILDRYIFLHHWKKIQGKDKSSQYQAHDFIPTVPAFAGFKDARIRDEFNIALISLDAGGVLKRIKEKYE